MSESEKRIYEIEKKQEEEMKRRKRGVTDLVFSTHSNINRKAQETK